MENLTPIILVMLIMLIFGFKFFIVKAVLTGLRYAKDRLKVIFGKAERNS